MSEFRDARWYAIRRAGRRSRRRTAARCAAATCRRSASTCSWCPRATRSRRRHAHTKCVMRARKAGRLPLREEVEPRRPGIFARLLRRGGVGVGGSWRTPRPRAARCLLAERTSAGRRRRRRAGVADAGPTSPRGAVRGARARRRASRTARSDSPARPDGRRRAALVPSPCDEARPAPALRPRRHQGARARALPPAPACSSPPGATSRRRSTASCSPSARARTGGSTSACRCRSGPATTSCSRRRPASGSRSTRSACSCAASREILGVLEEVRDP